MSNMSDATLVAQAAEQRQKRLAEAEAHSRALLESEPRNAAARWSLAQILTQTSRYDDAIGLLCDLLADGVNLPSVHKQLGIAYAGCAQLERSLEHFERALAGTPDDAQVLQFVANLQQQLGLTEAAQRSYRRVLQVQPLVTLAATLSPPTLRALLLFAPGAGNTPFEYLVEEAPFECHILNLLPDVPVDVGLLRDRCDVVVNLVADADQAAAVLGPAKDLVDRLQQPTVNHPRKIVGTDRASIARRLQSIAGCRVPATLRLSAAALGALDDTLSTTPLVFPILVRPVGTHGGERLQKVSDRAALDAYAVQCPASHYYLTQFVDYRSEDGRYRKYRFVFVGESIHPYHLAIDKQWKIHHATTDMARHRWMQEEEKAFLEDPQRVFDGRAYAALRRVRRAVGLDYFGIDCALDRKGRVLVFEVNACMLVHGRNEAFAYKNRAVRRIKTAFQALLESKAALERPPQIRLDPAGPGHTDNPD